jgi:predicted aspartyl protease
LEGPLRYSKIVLKIIPIEEDGCHIVVPAEINGKKANMLIDTGASKTVFDQNRIRNYLRDKNRSFLKNPQLSTGLGTTTLESHYTKLSRFRLGDWQVRAFPAILLDLANVNQSYALLGIPPIDGVIGSDLLKELQAQINFKSGVLKVYFR